MPDSPFAGERLIAGIEGGRAPFTVNFTANQDNYPQPVITTGAEGIWITTPAITFKASRAYRITVKGLLAPTATGSEGQVRVRKGALGGQLLFDSFRMTVPATGNYAFLFGNIITNSTGAAITAPIVGTVARSSGTANFTVNGSAVSPSYLHVEDVGPASDFNGSTSLS
ncbi:hypothetical protein [uncultured Streptomyces sp.]|uniref:hypothetical protein n=1 Tax=uncultured Streptomyces sp. TaxID=174707 RepID=UPI002634AAC0|nr:hypothetical protein [uncultured Streptomyces sp.]